MFACLLDNLINYFNSGCEEYEIFTYIVFQELYCFPVFVPIFSISAIFSYCVIRQLIFVVQIT